MKRTLALIALLLAIACHATDDTLYGAWWTTWNAEPGTAKGAGEFIAVFEDTDGNGARGAGHVTITVTDTTGTDSHLVNYTFRGTWSKTSNGKFLAVDIPSTGPGYSAIKGKFNIVNGAFVGTFTTSGVFRGKFQSARATFSQGQ